MLCLFLVLSAPQLAVLGQQCGQCPTLGHLRLPCADLAGGDAPRPCELLDRTPVPDINASEGRPISTSEAPATIRGQKPPGPTSGSRWPASLVARVTATATDWRWQASRTSRCRWRARQRRRTGGTPPRSRGLTRTSGWAVAGRGRDAVGGGLRQTIGRHRPPDEEASVPARQVRCNSLDWLRTRRRFGRHWNRPDQRYTEPARPSAGQAPVVRYWRSAAAHWRPGGLLALGDVELDSLPLIE